MGLLYGKGDFSRTLEISTRCGQDADCNPSSAGGILGTILGYSKIPDYWKQGLKNAEDIDFKYTNISLSDVYEIGMKHALLNIEKSGGHISGDKVRIPLQTPVAVKFEKSFEGMYPVGKLHAGSNLSNEYTFDFEGNGFVVQGETARWDSESSYVFQCVVTIDGKLTDTVALPTSYKDRRYELYWKYLLPNGKHQVKLQLLNPSNEYFCRISDILIYADKQASEKNDKLYRFGRY